MVRAIVGANWGDEGKGKVTDMFAETSDVVIRFQGGANAGHTIINNYGKFALHQLPSGVFFPHITNIIGNGVALNIPAFGRELKSLTDNGVPKPNMVVSDRAQVVMPYHVQLDAYEEERLSERKFGSTKSGIAPFYSDKYAKTGIQINELFDDARLRERLSAVCEVKNLLLKHVYHKPEIDFEALLEELKTYRDIVEPYVGDVIGILRGAKSEGKKILLEGQLGALRDPDFGIYPFTTSSHTLAGFGSIGACIAPYDITNITAVTKAYSSAVGAGAFVSEIFGDEAQELRMRGGDAGEFGATTGRPRRMGWFDAVATRYGCRVQHATEAVLTAIDVLGYLDEVKVCVGYEVDGNVTEDFPVTMKLNKAKPVYETLSGWKCDIRGVTEYSKLPKAARDYVEFIERLIEVPIKLVSTGPKRHEIIYR
ncbi:MAG: adenylosuccinate synthase [Oscillospiraceae bacterium]|jgi:adenylosuccinate synthase